MQMMIFHFDVEISRCASPKYNIRVTKRGMIAFVIVPNMPPTQQDAAMNYCYFLVDHLPATTPHKLWFAIWSKDKSRIEWTDKQPSSRDPAAPWTISVNVQLEDLPHPPGVTLLAKVTAGLKDVPPPPTLQAAEVSRQGFRAALEESFKVTAAMAGERHLCLASPDE